MTEDILRSILNSITDANEHMYESIARTGESLGLQNFEDEQKASVARRLYWELGIDEATLFCLLGISPLKLDEWIEWAEKKYECDCGETVVLRFKTREMLAGSNLGGVTCWKCHMSAVMAKHNAKWAAIRAKQIAQLRAMPYEEYLKTDHWQRIRKPILERDGHRCRLCNSTENLNVHHRTYERLGEENPDDLTTLCYACHQTFHENRHLAKGQAPAGSTENNGDAP